MRAHAAPGVTGLLKTLEGFRTELPPPANIGEMNGFMVKEADGKTVLLSHLSGVTRMEQSAHRSRRSSESRSRAVRSVARSV